MSAPRCQHGWRPEFCPYKPAGSAMCADSPVRMLDLARDEEVEP
jgi:hypothetical protein